MAPPSNLAPTQGGVPANTMPGAQQRVPPGMVMVPGLNRAVKRPTREEQAEARILITQVKEEFSRRSEYFPKFTYIRPSDLFACLDSVESLVPKNLPEHERAEFGPALEELYTQTAALDKNLEHYLALFQEKTVATRLVQIVCRSSHHVMWFLS